MSRVKELREKQATVVAEARERLDQINSNTDETRAAELETQHDTAMAEYDRLEKLIEREERTAKAEERAETQRGQRRPRPDDTDERAQDDDAPAEYREVFYKMLSAGGDVAGLSAEERTALRAGVVSGKDAEFRMQTTSGGSPAGSAGGYTVPVELAGFIDKAMKAWGPMYDEDICTTLNTSSGNQINIPTVDDTAVTAEKHVEGGGLTDDGGKDVTFGQKRLDAYAYNTEWVKFSWELAQDSIFNVEALLGDLLGERLGRIANKDLTTGDGAGDPNGIVTASTLGKTAAASAAITYDELIDLVHSVDPAYRSAPKVRFMFNDLTLSAIRKLKDGEGRYIWTQGDVTGGVPGAILGYRYSVNQAMDSIASGKKSVLFGDFGKYYVRKVGAPIIGVVRERFWPDIGIAGLIRFDGELANGAAVKHLLQA